MSQAFQHHCHLHSHSTPVGVTPQQEGSLGLHLQNVCCILLGQFSYAEVIVLVQHIDRLVAPLQELAEAEVG